MLNLTFACHDYDHVRDIFEPEVVTEGVELTQLKLQVEEIFFRFIKFGEFEGSLSRYFRPESFATLPSTSGATQT